MSTVLMGLYLFVLSVSDMLTGKISLWLMVIGIVPFVSSFFDRKLAGLTVGERLMGLLMGLLLLGMSMFIKKAFGEGDALVIGMLGITFGIVFGSLVLAAACMLVVPYSITMLARGRLKKGSKIAFIPFLFMGYLLLQAVA